MKKDVKRSVLTAVLAAALTLSMTACGSTDAGSSVADSQSAQSSESSQTGTTEGADSESTADEGTTEADADAHVAVTANEPNVLDVVRFLGIADRNVFYNVLEPLTRVENGVVVAAGAESWEVSEDGLTYTFHLRENYWNDGQKVVSGDYAEALYRQADPANNYAFASDIYCIENFKEAFNGEAAVDSIGVETPDDDTLVLHLNAPSPALLSTFDFFPERADYVEKYGDALGTEAESVAACGPFVLDSWVHNSELTFSKNDKYWDKDNVKLQSFAFEVITDSAASFAALQAGTIDYLTLTDIDNIETLQADENLEGVSVEGARTYMFVFNGKDELFQNEKVRRAFSLALDRETIVEDLYNGLGTPAYGLIPAASSVGGLRYRDYVEEPLKSAAEDPVELLNEGLSELGISSPSDVTVTLSFGNTGATTKIYGEYYQQTWQAALGVNVELSFNDSTTHMANIKSGDYQIALTSWGANLEPQFLLTRWVGGGQHKVDNETFDAYTNEAITTMDDQKRLELYGEAEKELVDSAMIAPIYYGGSMRFQYKFVKGISDNQFDTTGMKTVYTAGRP